ncbi:MAG: Endonuclease/exonuclease/phosphatase [Clostridia bacterium]|jgi:endonuclease/exonuclease/phosphatase family metal-dependent hydrolase|nr:Endonuclease/exonuclease/phosphatase [Clostridia bacterium]
MKATAFVTAALIFLICLTSGTGYFNMLTKAAEQDVFAYSSDNQVANIQMKPLSRGDTLERREQEVKLKLMTYNIHRGIGRNGRLDLNAVAEVINDSNAGIIALQEVERHSIRTVFQDQIKQLSEKTNMNFSYGKSVNVLNGEYGNGILSRYPIEEYMAYELPSFKERRTVLRTVINVDGLMVAVYNTHLGLNESERKGQVEHIIHMISEEKLEYLLMGDMNSNADKLTKITAHMKDSADGSEKQHQSTFIEKEVEERIDYIFVSPNMEVKAYDVLESEASDHYPVVSEVILSK